MGDQHRADFLQGLRQPVFEAAALQRIGKPRHNGGPLFGGHQAVHTTVGHQLDRVFGQQHVDQHAVVVLGVPHTQLGKLHQRPLAHDVCGRDPIAQMAPQVAGGQPAFHADAYLAGVALLAGMHAAAQALGRIGRHRAARVGFVHPAVAQQAIQFGQHAHQLPLAPPPPKSPPPPELKPPPPPPPNPPPNPPPPPQPPPPMGGNMPPPPERDCGNIEAAAENSP